MGGIYRKYTEPLLADAVANSTSVCGVLRYLGLAQAGGTHAHVSRAIRSFGLDTSHFVRYPPGARRTRLSPGEILVPIPFGSKRRKPHLLRRALVEIGVPYRCARCANAGAWREAPLVLEVDHIDGDFHNNAVENLRFLCPNCHAQTANYAGRSKGKYASAAP